MKEKDLNRYRCLVIGLGSYYSQRLNPFESATHELQQYGDNVAPEEYKLYMQGLFRAFGWSWPRTQQQWIDHFLEYPPERFKT